MRERSRRHHHHEFLRTLVIAEIDWPVVSLCCREGGCGVQPDAFVLQGRT